MMDEHDRADPRENGPSGQSPIPLAPAAAAGRPESKTLIPLLVEKPDADFGVVWLFASRSELTVGWRFTARGRRWVITGLSPSGVTYVCREVADEKPR